MVLLLSVAVAACGSTQVPTPSANGSPAASPLPNDNAITISSDGVAQHLAALEEDRPGA